MSSIWALGDKGVCGACVSAFFFSFFFAATLGGVLSRGEAQHCN